MYTNFTRKRGNLTSRDYKSFFITWIKDKVQKKDEHRMAEIFKGYVRNLHEPTTEEVIDLGLPYIHHSFEGEAILSVGKAIDFVKKGAAGIINAMPFTCMPGTVVAAVMKRVRRDLDNVPFLNMAYDGLEQTNTITRLEAFMYQAAQFDRHKKAEKQVEMKQAA